MRARSLVLSILAIGSLDCGWQVGSAVPPPSPVVQPPEPIAQQLRAEIHSVPGAVVGIYYRNLARPGDTVALDADSIFHAASTMKIAVMIQLFREVDAGELSLSQTVVVRNQFASIVDSTPYALDPKDDSDSGMYALAGQAVSVHELMVRMIQRSSNLATNTVIALVGAARVDSTAHVLGAIHMRVLRGVEDGKAFALGLNNVTSARDLAALLMAIYTNRAASAADCAAMLEVLLGQEFNTEIPAGLPSGTRVAHKTGQITGVLHDAAIVYPAGGPPYVLVVLTRGIPDEHVAQGLIARVSRLVYTHAMAAGAASG
jgi:beta-lactamase class A